MNALFSSSAQLFDDDVAPPTTNYFEEQFSLGLSSPNPAKFDFTTPAIILQQSLSTRRLLSSGSDEENGVSATAIEDLDVSYGQRKTEPLFGTQGSNSLSVKASAHRRRGSSQPASPAMSVISTNTFKTMSTALDCSAAFNEFPDLEELAADFPFLENALTGINIEDFNNGMSNMAPEHSGDFMYMEESVPFRLISMADFMTPHTSIELEAHNFAAANGSNPPEVVPSLFSSFSCTGPTFTPPSELESTPRMQAASPSSLQLPQSLLPPAPFTQLQAMNTPTTTTFNISPLAPRPPQDGQRQVFLSGSRHVPIVLSHKPQSILPQSSVGKAPKVRPSLSAIHTGPYPFHGGRRQSEGGKHPPTPISALQTPTLMSASTNDSVSPTSAASSETNLFSPTAYENSEGSVSPKRSGTERIYKCLRCPSAFRRSHDLKRHVRSLHTMVKPFQCTKCDKSFSRMDALKRHVSRPASDCFVDLAGGAVLVLPASMDLDDEF